jgi:hypothetical protein
LKYWNGSRCCQFRAGQGANVVPISAAISAKRATPVSAKIEATLGARGRRGSWLCRSFVAARCGDGPHSLLAIHPFCLYARPTPVFQQSPRPETSGTYERGVERNEGAQFLDTGNYHFHPALELSPAGLAAPATGISESVVVAAGWTGNGSSSVAQPISTKRVAIARQVTVPNRFMEKYESAPARRAMLK